MIALAEPMEFYKTFLEWYINQVKAESYLEVGCADGGLVYRLLDKCPSLGRAVGVDIAKHNRNNAPKATFFHLPSDDFFDQNKHTFDVVLVDGDHSAVQAFTDANNALSALSPNGLVLMHDTWPPDAEHTRTGACGDAWKAAELLHDYENLHVFTFPVTFGLTLVRKVEERPWL